MNPVVMHWGAWGLRAALCIALLYAAVATAWVADDAQITFRQVWNFVNGDGMTFNYGERVQAFTHPAWFMLLSGAVFVTRELFFTTLALSIALSVAAVALLLAAEQRGRGSIPLLTPAWLLLFSVAFCDYMASGLENPLSYFLVGSLLWFLAGDNGRRWSFLLLALLVLNRPDYALLFLPLAILLAVSSFRVRHLLRDVWPGALLLLAWFGFALIYFGSPLPNTFYAKMAADYPTAEVLERGINYYRAMLHRDPVSLLIIAAGFTLSIISRRPVLLALAAGQVLYLGFILKAGGDFMQGRFFALPVFLSVGQMVLAMKYPPPARRRAPAADKEMPLPRRLPLKGGVISAALLLLAIILGGLAKYPFATTPGFHNATDIFAVMDERGFWYWPFGLMSPNRDWPQVVRQSDEPPRLARFFCGNLGQESLRNANAHIIDECALAEPFLARLPAIRRPHWRIGHHARRLPTDYYVYVLGMASTIADENLRPLLRDVRLAARADDLFTRERLKALWRLNTGHYARLDLSRYQSAQSLPGASAPERHLFRISLSDLPRRPKSDGHLWRAGDVSPWFFNAARITVDPPRPATALQLSLSHMEDYEIHINGEPVAAIARVSAEGLLQNHTVTLPQPTMVHTITIRTGGRHIQRAFSIGHLHLR